jgi:uncharacterized protein (DUF433 family)
MGDILSAAAHGLARITELDQALSRSDLQGLAPQMMFFEENPAYRAKTLQRLIDYPALSERDIGFLHWSTAAYADRTRSDQRFANETGHLAAHLFDAHLFIKHGPALEQSFRLPKRSSDFPRMRLHTVQHALEDIRMYLQQHSVQLPARMLLEKKAHDYGTFIQHSTGSKPFYTPAETLICKDAKGKAWVKGTSVSVAALAVMREAGFAPESIAEEYQANGITLAQVHQALAYAREHNEEIEQDVAHAQGNSTARTSRPYASQKHPNI